MKIFQWYIVTLGSALLACGCAVAPDADELIKIELKNVAPREVFREIAEKYLKTGIRICFEEGRATGGKAAVSFSSNGLTWEQALARAITNLSGYAWTYDPTNKMVNVYPVSGGLLDWKVTANIENKTVDQILATDDLLDIGTHNLAFNSVEENAKWLQTRVTIKGTELPVREVLNRICLQMPWKARWEVILDDPGTPCWLVIR